MALSSAVVAVLLAWGGTAFASKEIWLNNTHSDMTFAPKGAWSNMDATNSKSAAVRTCGDKSASIVIQLPENTTTVRWWAFKFDRPAAYLVCFDCTMDDDASDAQLVDAHQRASSDQSVLIWESQALPPNVAHTMLIRNTLDPRFNSYSVLSMDALSVNVAEKGDPDPGAVSGSPAGDDSDGISKPALIVGVIGGVEFFAIVVAATVFFIRRNRLKKRRHWAGSYGWLGSDDKQQKGRYTSVRKSPEAADAAPDLVLDIYDPELKRRETSSSFGDVRKDQLPKSVSSHGSGTSIAASATPVPAPSQHQTSTSSTSSPQHASRHATQPSAASNASHAPLISPAARAQSPGRVQVWSAASYSATPPSSPPAKPKAPSPVAAVVAPSAEAGPSSQPLIRYRDPYELRPPPPPASASGSYGRPWGSSESGDENEKTPPPAKLEATFAAAYAPTKQLPHIPPLPFHLPPTRPVSEAHTISPIDDLPLPEFSSPPPSAGLSHTLSSPGTTRPVSAIIRPKRRPGGPRILSGSGMQGRTRSSSLGGVVGSVIPEGEEGSTSSSPPAFTPPPTADVSFTPHTIASSHGTDKTRPVSKVLPPTPIVDSPTSSLPPSSASKGKAPELTSRIRIPSFKYSPGQRPRRKSTGSSAPHSAYDSPTVIEWDPDFLEFESTPEGTMVTVRSKHSNSNETASSPLVPRGVEEEIDDGVLTSSHHSDAEDDRRETWRTIPGAPYDIGQAMRRVMRKESPRLVESSSRYEPLP
ncbi:hypothetical protein AURDEDRAFT_182354 [Auricularia subglabra TFB-10046 SS5]|nr:hypothetical protein AURDEDRAFT_182354 [Auricularia subglabra TFB-10046 SS5]